MGIPVLGLVLSWSTNFGLGPSLEYQLWTWSQPGVLNTVFVPALSHASAFHSKV